MNLQDFSKGNLKFYLHWQNTYKVFNSLNSGCSDGELLGCLVKKSPSKSIAVFPREINFMWYSNGRRGQEFNAPKWLRCRDIFSIAKNLFELGVFKRQQLPIPGLDVRTSSNSGKKILIISFWNWFGKILKIHCLFQKFWSKKSSGKKR